MKLYLKKQWLLKRGYSSRTKQVLTMSQAKLANQYTAGFTPLTNCRCLALFTRSWMRKRTKLAGMKDMAKITQMDTTTSVEVVALWLNRAQQTGSWLESYYCVQGHWGRNTRIGAETKPNAGDICKCLISEQTLCGSALCGDEDDVIWFRKLSDTFLMSAKLGQIISLEHV